MRYLLILVCLVFIRPLYAASWGTDCIHDELPAYEITLPEKSVSIDPYAPVGTVLFEYLVSSKPNQSFKCNTSGAYTLQGGYTYGAGGQYVTISGGGLTSQSGAAYRVYKTDVEGIGMVVRNSGFAFPYMYSSVISYTNKVLNYTTSATQIFDINIIKYGDIPPGAHTVTIDSSVISSIDSFARVSGSSDINRLPNGDVVTARFVLSPSKFHILSATCDTPDSTVNLGVRQISDRSNREAGKFATPWVDASIRLINCPVFYGTGERGNFKGITRDNTMTITLIPGNATTSNQGIMPLDTGAQAAGGVGIQMAWGTSASPLLVDFSAGKGTKTYTMSSTQGANYTVPLVARYMQTAASLSGISVGEANGKVTYLVNYY